MTSLKLWATFLIISLFTSWMLPYWHEQTENIELSNGTRLEWTPCWFEVPLSQILKRINCAYLHTSDKIRLPVVTIKNRFWTHEQGPVLYLTGGPGYPTEVDQKGIEFWLAWLELNDFTFDLVLFDPRGTGMSQPRIDCPEVMELTKDTLDQNLTLEDELSLGISVLQQCYQRLHDSGIPLANFTTTHNSRDVANLMEALGGKNWNIYGASYGTRLALSVIRDYPKRVRSVILDSVYPPQINDFLETPFVYHNALLTFFYGCKTSIKCNTAFPNLEASFFNMLAQLRENPIELTVSVPNSKKSVKIVINDHRFISIVFQALYRWDFLALLPSIIEAAQHENYQPMIPLVEDFVTWLLDTNFSDAVYYSVECHDSFPETTREDYMAQVDKYHRINQFVKPLWDYNACKIWQVGYANPAFRKPVTSDIPTLFLAGEYDPVTPPIWAQKTATHFSQGYFFVFPGIGHGAVDSDYCAPLVMQAFWQNPTQKPHHQCLSELSGTHFIYTK
jgi:pimeloyl-ACP methyl ester carboxylesterase